MEVMKMALEASKGDLICQGASDNAGSAESE